MKKKKEKLGRQNLEMQIVIEEKVLLAELEKQYRYMSALKKNFTVGKKFGKFQSRKCRW